MEAATAPLESSECGMAFVAHVPPVLFTTKLPKYALLFVQTALSGPTLIENASAPPTISTLEEFA